MSVFKINSLEQYHQQYQESVENPEKFWARIATHFLWHKQPKNILEWDFENFDVKWFKDGELNITENCLDRHLADRGETPALIWEPNDPEEHHRVLTYNDLHEKVNQF